MDRLGGEHRGVLSLIRQVPRPIKLIAVVMFFFEFGFGFIDPWWTIYIERITSSYLLTGIVVALFSLTGLLVALPLGQVIDRFNHQLLIRGSLVMYLVVSSLYFAAGYLNSVPLLVLAVLVNGVSSIIIYQTAQAYVDRHYQGDLPFNYSFYVSLDALGYLLGTLAVLAVVAWWPLYWGYLIVALFVLLTLLVERRLPANTVTSNYSQILKQLLSGKLLIRAVRALPHYHSFFYIQVLAVFGLLFMSFGYQVFLPLYGLEQHLSLVQIGLASIFFVIPIFLSFYYAALLQRVARHWTILIFFLFISLLMFMFVSWHTQVAFYLVSFLFSSAVAVLNLTVRPMLFHLSPAHLEGEAAAITKVAEKSATILAPLVVGGLAAWAGVGVSHLLFAMIALSLGVVTFLSYRSFQRGKVPSHLRLKLIHRSGN